MKILIIDDDKSIRNATSLAIRAEGHEADTADSGRVALLKLREEIYDLIFLDLRIGDEDGLDVLREIRRSPSPPPIVVFTAYASIETAVGAMQAGASDYLAKPFTPEQIRHVIARIGKAAAMERRIETLEGVMAGTSPRAEFSSDDPRVAQVYDVLTRAARSPASLLILGESGTGKSLAARAVHDRSHLADGPFVTVSCPSLSRELLESELFGHMKGAFTGAVKDTWGKVAAARGGTLFLDEIGELPLEIQPKLLRLLQDREYERVGESKTHAADVRVIAATNRDLAAAATAGTFREDLYYRLNVISVTLPPLRRRQRDLVPLSTHFLQFFARQLGRTIEGFDDSAVAKIVSHPWPGNMRELRNVIERAAILSTGKKITETDLFEHTGPRDSELTDMHVGALVSIEKLERMHIERVLAVTGNQEAAARILGIDPATLYRKRKRWERSAHA
jgi:two-component system, NtrC family, response regulator AlgB